MKHCDKSFLMCFKTDLRTRGTNKSSGSRGTSISLGSSFTTLSLGTRLTISTLKSVCKRRNSSVHLALPSLRVVENKKRFLQEVQQSQRGQQVQPLHDHPVKAERKTVGH